MATVRTFSLRFYDGNCPSNVVARQTKFRMAIEDKDSYVLHVGSYVCQILGLFGFGVDNSGLQ